MSFWGELKRRNVYKVGVAYVIVAWLIIQAVSITFPVLHLPGWAVTLVTVLVIIGFPFALLFAWAFEVTPEGIKRTKEVPLAESITHLTGQKLNYIVTGLLVVAVAFLAFKVYFADRRATEPEMVSTETEQVPAVSDVAKVQKTIAVLPFVDISPEKDQEYFVDGLSEELLNTLAQIPDLGVTARTSSFTFKNSDKKVQEIASELGVDNVLEGSVRKAGTALRITAQLVRASDGLHLWSKTYDRELKDIFAVQEDIATAVASELEAALGVNKSLKQLGGTDNEKAYELYLIAQGKRRDREFSQALETINTAIALDPEFALAWAQKASIHIGLSIWGTTSDRAAEEQDLALSSIQKAIEIEPNLAASYYELGSIKMSKGEWINTELTYRKALELTTEPLSGDKSSMAVYYHDVGYFERAHEILAEIRRNDPLEQSTRGLYMLKFAFIGDTQGAEEEYERGNILFGGKWSFGQAYITYLRLGSGNVVSSDIVYSSPIHDLAKERLDSPKEGLAKLRRIFTSNENLSTSDLFEISIWAGYYGDPELAMDTIEKAARIEASGIFHLWFPVMKEIRQTPRFKEFIREIGLVEYWNEFGWPDLCRPLDNGDFECD